MKFFKCCIKVFFSLFKYQLFHIWPMQYIITNIATLEFRFPTFSNGILNHVWRKHLKKKEICSITLYLGHIEANSEWLESGSSIRVVNHCWLMFYVSTYEPAPATASLCIDMMKTKTCRNLDRHILCQSWYQSVAKVYN